MTGGGKFTQDEARAIGEAIDIDWTTSRFDVAQFRMGLDVELEHGRHDLATNVTDDDETTTGKIARAHLNEFPDYYSRLARMEAEAEQFWSEHGGGPGSATETATETTASGPALPRGGTPSGELVELSRSECLALLAATQLGRVVVATALADTPIIRPVNYVFDTPSQSVVFRTSQGSKFHALVHSAKAWFEIDSFDPHTRTGWSVIISGVTEQVTGSTEINEFDRRMPHSWAPGDRPHWIRIRASTVSGRRIGGLLRAPA